MMADIEKDTVDYQPTYDDSSIEPTVLPTVVPEPARERRRRHRGRHGHQHPAPQPGRGGGRRCIFLLASQDLTPDERLEGVIDARPRPRLPDRGLHLRPGRHPPGLPHRPRRRSSCAPGPRSRSRKGDKESIVDHRDPVPGEQGAPHREDRRAAPREADRGHHGRARRERPPAACASWSTSRRASRRRCILNNLYKHTPLQDTLRHHHAGHRRPAAARAEPARGLRALHRLPPRGGAPAHRLRAAQGGGPRPRPRGLRHRPRPPRRGDRPHPRAPRTPAEAQDRPHRPASA